MQNLQGQGHGCLLESWEFAPEARPGRRLQTPWPAREPDAPASKAGCGQGGLGSVARFETEFGFSLKDGGSWNQGRVCVVFNVTLVPLPKLSAGCV